MARLFDGTDDAAYVALNLSAYSLITVSHWGWWDSYSTSDGESYFEFGDPNWAIAGGWISFPNHSTSAHHMGMHNATIAWQDTFPRPSAAAWHHFMLVYNRATPVQKAYVDGVLQTLTLIGHDAGSYGNFANTNLNFASRAHTSLFADCRMAETAIWGGVELGLAEAKALHRGVSPNRIRPGNRVLYAPFYGTGSPEPNYVGGGNTVTLVGTSQTAHPPVMPAWGFDEAGRATTAVSAFALDAAPGSYALTGISAGTLATRILNATPGSYGLTGVAATVLAARLLSADPGAYVVTGTAAALLSTRLLNADPGTYILTGAAAELLFGAAAAGAFALNAVPGVYTLTGVAAQTAAGRVFNLSPGSYQLTGYATGLSKGQRLTLIDHTPAGLTLVDLTGATLTLVDLATSESLTVSGSPTFNGDSTVTVNTTGSDRLLAPASLIDETQAWVALRLRMGWPSTHATNPRPFTWGASPDKITALWNSTSDCWRLVRAASGGAAAENLNEGTTEVFSAGDKRTVIFAWDATRIRISGQGRAFTNSAAAVDIPTITETVFDIGADGDPVSLQIDSDILWFACGTGTLTDADAATIHAFGDTDPSRDALPGSCTAVMPMNSAAYNESLLSLTDVTTVLL